MTRAFMGLLMCLSAVGAAAMPGEDEPVTPIQLLERVETSRIELGRKLFHDSRLSHGNAVACSACHQLHSGGDDGRVRSLGSDGQPLDFNTPTVFNVSGNS